MMKMQAFPPTSRAAQRSGGGEAGGAPGLCLLSALTASELGEALPATQARGFYLAIGRRIAALEPLDGVADTAALHERINAFWQALGWGAVDIEVGSQAIVVRHRGAPASIPAANAQYWRPALLALLEGAYDAWFRILGSGPSLKTTAQWKGDAIELRHGR